MLFLGMMLGNVLLLDLYNTLGLPTSTTVSMVFGLLGAAVAAALFRIAGNPGTSLQDLSQFINTGKAMVIIAAILLSVALAFVAGTLFMYISRLDLLVPLRRRLPPLGSRLVRHLAGRNPLFRAVQGVEKLGTDPDLRFGLRRRPRPRDAPRLLGRGVAPPLHFPAHAAQHHAHHDPVGNLLAGPCLRRQRPGELHRRAAGRLRRLAHRRRGGQRNDDDGGARRLPPGPTSCCWASRD